MAAMTRADPGGMLGLVAELPSQVDEAWRITRRLELPWETPRSVAVLGMGGSAIGGDLVKGIWSDRLTVPIEVIRDYELPAWVGRDTLVVASSKSGGTEETISSLSSALERRCPVVVVTTGGPLRDVAQRVGLPLVTFPAHGTPRSSVGYSLGILAGILERTGVLALDASEIDAAVASARETAATCAPDVPTEDNQAKRLAWAMLDRFCIIVGSASLAPVARRWKAQLNENGKAAATFEELPEATHNTVVGFEQPESLRDHLCVIFLEGDLEHPRNRLRAEVVGELLARAHVSHHVVRARGRGRLGQALSAITIGDHVSVYVAFAYAVDPSPVGVIDHIKGRLAAVDEGAREGADAG
jgi:glucose/mannose-6-phosphate isomerase